MASITPPKDKRFRPSNEPGLPKDQDRVMPYSASLQTRSMASDREGRGAREAATYGHLADDQRSVTMSPHDEHPELLTPSPADHGKGQ